MDAGLDSPPSPLRAERIAARDVLDTGRVLHLSPRTTPINAQRVGPILPPSYPQLLAAKEVTSRHTVGIAGYEAAIRKVVPDTFRVKPTKVRKVS